MRNDDHLEACSERLDFLLTKFEQTTLSDEAGFTRLRQRTHELIDELKRTVSVFDRVGAGLMERAQELADAITRELSHF